MYNFIDSKITIHEKNISNTCFAAKYKMTRKSQNKRPIKNPLLYFSGQELTIISIEKIFYKPQPKYVIYDIKYIQMFVFLLVYSQQKNFLLRFVFSCFGLV